jgi:hypothetical protein
LADQAEDMPLLAGKFNQPNGSFPVIRDELFRIFLGPEIFAYPFSVL